ncbi:MAG: hypothetical protein P4L48_23500 [Mycobacterium sp.]|nr:hypothetical protein [Mycobacterium sp.]
MAPEIEQLQRSFLAHSHYLRAFAQLAGFGYWPAYDDQTLAALASKVASAFPASASAPPAVDMSELAKCLNRAWGTELILNLGARFEEDELVRLSNSWGSVQTYYVGYAATQALIVAEGRARPTEHSKTQGQVRALWVDRKSAVEPFSFAAMPGSKSNALAYANGPGRPVDTSLSTWTSVDTDNCWDIAATALRSTRNDAVEKRLKLEREKKALAAKKLWLSEEQARIAQGKKARKTPSFPTSANLTADERSGFESKMRPFTMLDYLYRLRIKANYEEAAMFTDGPDTDGASAIVALDMIRIANANMIAHEVRIARELGKSTLMALAKDWVDSNAPPSRMGIGGRMAILDQVL